MRIWRWLALAGAAGTFLLILLGGIVRITGSGMGCGDDWPLCNGELIPPLDLPTLIEYGHRLVAAGLSLPVLGLAALGWWWGRGDPAWVARRRIGYLAAALLVLQVLLGAVTVWLALPPASVVLHLATAMCLLAALAVASVHASVPARAFSRRRDVPARLGVVGALFGLLTVAAGALVANLDAGLACQGFPLCNGEWLPPSANWRIRLHWTHRALAYLLAAWALALPVLTRRWRPGDRAAGSWARAVAGVALAQVMIAAVMVLRFLPGALRALHLGVGTAVFAALVVHAWMLAHSQP